MGEEEEESSESTYRSTRPVEKNIAYQLADLFEDWFVPANANPESYRGFADGDFNDIGVWRHHARAVDLVRQVDDAIQAIGAAGSPTGFYRRHLPKWYRAAYGIAAPLGVAISQSRAVCDEDGIDVLRALGARLDENGASVPVTAAERAAVRRHLTELERLLGSDVMADLPTDVRLYL